MTYKTNRSTSKFDIATGKSLKIGNFLKVFLHVVFLNEPVKYFRRRC